MRSGGIFSTNDNMKTELQYSTNVHSERSTPPDAKHLLAPVPLSVVFNEDCMSGLKRFPDGYFDLAICDIPYGINVGKMAYLKETKTTVKQKNGTRLNGNKNKEVYSQKDWDKDPLFCTIPISTPISIISPVFDIPSPKIMSNWVS